MTKKFAAEDLEERLIAEVAKRVRGVRGYYPTSRAADAMEGIVKTPFTSEIEREERPKDFNPPTLDKYEGTGDPMAHLLHYKQKMSMERVTEEPKLQAIRYHSVRKSFVLVLSTTRRFHHQFHVFRQEISRAIPQLPPPTKINVRYLHGPTL